MWRASGLTSRGRTEVSASSEEGIASAGARPVRDANTQGPSPGAAVCQAGKVLLRTATFVLTVRGSARQRGATIANGDEEIQPLRQALDLSPENLPLRLLLARSLMRHFRYQEAEEELRGAMAQAPDNGEAGLLLADTFFRQSKYSESLALVETMSQRGFPPPPVRLLHARLLAQAGQVPEAIARYRDAVADDPGLIDNELAERLGLDADEGSDLVEGMLRAGEIDAEDLPVDLERPRIDFEDVGGMEDVKEEIEMKIIHPLTHPEIYQAYGKKIGGGILLYGPPGCGKTHLARATAGQVQALFLSVGINDVVDMWIGNSEKNLHELFEQARAHSPCVLFFDEVDALGASRSDLKTSAGRNLINQFLSELDGVGSDNDGVLVLAATNAPWHLDSAFRRPGRFDRIVFVPPPDAAARARILDILLRDKPTDGVDTGALARKTEHFSGADLTAVVDQAVESKLRDAMRRGAPSPLGQKDLLRGIKRVKPSTREWFTTARNHALYANQGGVYDDIIEYMNLRR